MKGWIMGIGSAKWCADSADLMLQGTFLAKRIPGLLPYSMNTRTIILKHFYDSSYYGLETLRF